MFGSRIERRDLCSLCGKTKAQVRNLVVGLHGAVCDDCVDLCNAILNRSGHEAPKGDVEVAPGGLLRVTIDPDVARLFPTEDAVNAGLRFLAKAVQDAAEKPEL